VTTGYHPLVKRLLDGELALAELPPELQAEGAEALRLLAAMDRRLVTPPPTLEARVMAAVGARAASPSRRMLRWIAEPGELHWRGHPWLLGAGLAAGALVLLLGGPVGLYHRRGTLPMVAAAPESVFVRFVLYAPGAKQVGLAGTFNQWDQSATPLVRAGNDAGWTVTLALPAGQHQYAFVVDGRRWVTDPAAPAVGDGVGRRHSRVPVGRGAGGGAGRV